MNTSKRSKQRDAILDAVKNTKCHPTADWVYSEVRKIIPNISLGTVYRNLSKLSDERVIAKLSLGTASEHFDGNTELHYHVHCIDCDRIYDIENKLTFDINEWASELFNGEIFDHYTVFSGRCSKCKNKLN